MPTINRLSAAIAVALICSPALAAEKQNQAIEEIVITGISGTEMPLSSILWCGTSDRESGDFRTIKYLSRYCRPDGKPCAGIFSE